jgi:hypothetical protein
MFDYVSFFFPQKRTWKIKILKKEVILEVFCH